MIAAWILYASLVGVLVGAGALVVEHLLRAHKFPTRWVWAGAMFVSILWPLGHLVWRNLPRAAASIPFPDPSRVAVLNPLAVQVTQESFLRNLDGPIVLIWLLSTSVLLGVFGFLVARTRRLQREWKDDQAGGEAVLFSMDLGPAVVGYVRPRIVLPGWCRELEEETLALILDHEREHLKAGDLRLILTAGVLPLLLPWHFLIWWQFKRLRLAVEGDCDLRVVRKYPGQTRTYMEMLIQVGGQPPRAPALVAMLFEPEKSLAMRIQIMTMPFPKSPWVRGAVLASVGGLLVAAAFWAPRPTDLPQTDAGRSAVDAPGPPVSPDLTSSAPVFTPFTVRPDIKNRVEVARALEENYPPLLRDAGIGGTAQVWFFIDEKGLVQRMQIKESSGHKALDDAALSVGGVLQFTPALNRDKPVPVWISLPITFSTRGTRSSPVVVDRDIAAAPTFTPYTVQPDITNRAEVARALEENYPPLLRDAGIGGTAHIWFFIDEDGFVEKVQINRSSGERALDDAALRVAEDIRFSPALNRDKPVPVWISLPIAFVTR